MSEPIGPQPALPDDAHDLHVLAIDFGRSRWFNATLERPGVDALRLLIGEAWKRGHVYDYRLTDPEDAGDVAVLDILDAAGDIVHDLAIPTAESLAWWMRVAELRCYESHPEPIA